MEVDRFSRLQRMAEDTLDSVELKPDTYLMAYALYSLVDATSMIEGAIDDNREILKKIESHLHHMGLEAWNK
tara:strand:- start:236 stop:451 length:216 start_codon:yes stop_codon:yes gene_type:complete